MSNRLLARGRLLLALATVPALVSCNTAAVKHGYMSLDAQGSRRRSTFYTDTDTIYCIAELAVGRADVTVQGTFRALDFSVPPKGDWVPTNTVLAVSDLATSTTGSDVIAAFQLIKKVDTSGPWPAGRFVCELSIDGELEESVPFEILYPDCPFQPPFDGDQCAGFFLPASSCPGAVTAQTCVCSDTGTWQCR